MKTQPDAGQSDPGQPEPGQPYPGPLDPDPGPLDPDPGPLAHQKEPDPEQLKIIQGAWTSFMKLRKKQHVLRGTPHQALPG